MTKGSEMYHAKRDFKTIPLEKKIIEVKKTQKQPDYLGLLLHQNILCILTGIAWQFQRVTTRCFDAKISTLFTVSIGTPYLLTILILKFEIVHLFVCLC